MEARLPLLLVSPQAGGRRRGLDCTVRITQSSGEVVEPVVVRFAPYTERGASVLAYRPARRRWSVDFATPFDVRLDPGVGGEPATMRDLFELRVVEGNLARLLYVIGSEKMRLRRQANELYAMRRTRRGAGDALDRLGAELGVPRFDARLAWEATLRTPTIVRSARRTRRSARASASTAHSARIAPRGRDATQRAGYRHNAGSPSRLGVTHRLTIAEPDTELLGPCVWSRPRTTRRVPRSWITHGRRSCSSPVSTSRHARLLPSDVRAEENALRARLAVNFGFPANAHIAPILARRIDRVGKCRRALRVTRRWRVLRTQDDAGGSRYELGLGVDVEAVPPAELDRLAANHLAGNVAADTPPEIRALLAQMQPQSSTNDPQGRWLLAPCGLATVHPLDATKTYVSHLALHGLVIGKNVTAGPDAARCSLERTVRLGPRCTACPRAP